MPTNERQPYDMLEVIRCIVDYGESSCRCRNCSAPPALVGFACIDGKPVGIVANQLNVLVGILDVDFVREKSPDSVRLCDAFNLPVVTFRGCPATSPVRPGTRRYHLPAAPS